MKRLAMLLCLLTSACATARVTQPWPDLEPAPAASSSPARAVHRMALGRLPRLQLREMALGGTRTVDQILNSTLDQDQTVGFTQYPATGGAGGNVVRYAFGDTNTALQSGNSARLQIYAWHGIDILAGRNSGTPPAEVAGGGSADGVNITTGTAGLVVDHLVQGTVLQVSSSLIAPVVTATNSGALTNQMGIEIGQNALTAGAVTKTFSPAFAATPMCTCIDQTATAAVKCTPATTTLTIAGTGTDTINWICIGRK